MIHSLFWRAVGVQVVYGFLVITWQVAGLLLIAIGRQPLGPTASASVAIFAAVSTALCVALARSLPSAYVLASCGLALVASTTILNAFTADPNNWPSDLSRYLGIAVNSVGVLAAALAIFAFIQMRGKRGA